MATRRRRWLATRSCGAGRTRPAQRFATRSCDTAPSHCLRARCRALRRCLERARLGRSTRDDHSRHPLRRSSPGRLGELEGADAFVAIGTGWIDLASDVQVEIELLAGGTGATVVRHVYSGHLVDGGGEVEIAVIGVNLIDERGRSRYFEVFEGTDADAAFRRFEEIGAQTEPELSVARFCRLHNARDWDALAATYDKGRRAHRHAPDQLGDDAGAGGDRADVPLMGRGGRAGSWRLRFEVLAGDDRARPRPRLGGLRPCRPWRWRDGARSRGGGSDALIDGRTRDTGSVRRRGRGGRGRPLRGAPA